MWRARRGSRCSSACPTKSRRNTSRGCIIGTPTHTDSRQVLAAIGDAYAHRPYRRMLHPNHTAPIARFLPTERVEQIGACPMPYKVFFVEDEIVTREGIRDNVDWQAEGFELCGEAPDGEMALPLLQATKPDVLITDIKMPFMDGLQLSKIVRERMPQTKVVILSGHDEFEYAREAIQLGVTEYLLKPVTVQDIHHVLQKLARQISQEEKEQADLHRLQSQVQENRAAL